MKYYFYVTPPIDFWQGSLSYKELVKNAKTNLHITDRRKFLNNVELLQIDAEKVFSSVLKYDGDMRHDAFFAIPMELAMGTGYIIKQDNDGTCFIASPIPLRVPFFEKTTRNLKGLFEDCF